MIGTSIKLVFRVKGKAFDEAKIILDAAKNVSKP